MPTGTTCRQLTIVLLSSCLLAASAESADGPRTSIDRLEYRIEIDRHKRLANTRKSKGDILSPFTADGCSGGVSAGWTLLSSALPAFAKRHGNRPPWESCCIAHDRLYHKGGASDAEASFEARRQADEKLRQCVIKFGEERTSELTAQNDLNQDEVELLYRGIGDVMYRAVRLGGAPCTGLSWRWGFGRPPCD